MTIGSSRCVIVNRDIVPPNNPVLVGNTTSIGSFRDVILDGNVFQIERGKLISVPKTTAIGPGPVPLNQHIARGGTGDGHHRTIAGIADPGASGGQVVRDHRCSGDVQGCLVGIVNRATRALNRSARVVSRGIILKDHGIKMGFRSQVVPETTAAAGPGIADKIILPGVSVGINHALIIETTGPAAAGTVAAHITVCIEGKDTTGPVIETAPVSRGCPGIQIQRLVSFDGGIVERQISIVVEPATVGIRGGVCLERMNLKMFSSNTKGWD